MTGPARSVDDQTRRFALADELDRAAVGATSGEVERHAVDVELPLPERLNHAAFRAFHGRRAAVITCQDPSMLKENERTDTSFVLSSDESASLLLVPMLTMPASQHTE